MLKIGITGGIGSGKSTISKVFEVLGIPVFYADDQAKKVMTDDPILIDAIKSTFGDESYFADGALNRKYLAGIVFKDDVQLAKLNAIAHPATFRAFDKWLSHVGHVPYILKEAALLFESGSYKLCDKSLMVFAPFEMRMARVLLRDNITRAEAESRNAKQFDDEKKLNMADYVIKNDDSQLVIPQVLDLHREFLKLAGK
ncbi:dephospho-CoA kinase [Mucilaginibacter paludis]|uniref:Dephospho-CoA kinase n=1 Tax=Mucilaginibacter paludis DSM 18603 TaxID=714943 RepID=H1Y7E1_9SPHI|nr:dephospho-CoA kinase [Mucilaginibacter paludis]EHQ29028.1 Dephospho-CoA kinase [Mucilaginibacter paludis DSM 18603]